MLEHLEHSKSKIKKKNIDYNHIKTKFHHKTFKEVRSSIHASRDAEPLLKINCESPLSIMHNRHVDSDNTSIFISVCSNIIETLTLKNNESFFSMYESVSKQQ